MTQQEKNNMKELATLELYMTPQEFYEKWMSKKYQPPNYFVEQGISGYDKIEMRRDFWTKYDNLTGEIQNVE